MSTPRPVTSRLHAAANRPALSAMVPGTGPATVSANLSMAQNRGRLAKTEHHVHFKPPLRCLFRSEVSVLALGRSLPAPGFRTDSRFERADGAGASAVVSGTARPPPPPKPISQIGHSLAADPKEGVGCNPMNSECGIETTGWLPRPSDRPSRSNPH